MSVHAIWATSTKQSEELIYKVTAALWNPSTRKLLDLGHAKGREIRLETATRGLGIPLHPGAEKFYKEQGLISKENPPHSNGEVPPSYGGGGVIRPSISG